MKSQPAEQASAHLLPLAVATALEPPNQPQLLVRARGFAEPLIAAEALDTGENTLAHADAVAAILKSIGGSEVMQAASYLVYACDHLNKPQDVIAKAFGANLAALAMETTKLVRVQRQARTVSHGASPGGVAPPMAQTAAAQTENIRKMLLAFSRDLRVVMLRLASRLQTLRHFAATKLPVPPSLARESLQVFAPLANRLGIWEIKWELDDLAFRFLEPDTYREVARLLDQKRALRESGVETLRRDLQAALQADGVTATVQGRPKHIYSIVRKMRGKSLGFEQVYDVRALRIIVASVSDCYQALGHVHNHFAPVAHEFDDYVAKPKANGYQSLHTVVRDQSAQAIEIQIRTQAMHDHAEHGVAAHWVYKEAGTKGYASVSAGGQYDAKIAVLRQLLAWQRDLSGDSGQGIFEDHIYV
ncbi:MAG: HD domain-containing protein, partial [Rhodoferax sp.]|nr:HD domain-containing protein [Rhodoferax sp.]